MVTVTKPDKVQICIDPQELNTVTTKPRPTLKYFTQEGDLLLDDIGVRQQQQMQEQVSGVPERAG